MVECRIDTQSFSSYTLSKRSGYFFGASEVRAKGFDVVIF